MKKFDTFLEELGEFVHRHRIPLNSLRPSQEAIFLGKVVDIASNSWTQFKFGGPPKKEKNSGLIASSDNYLVEGHHRWAALLLNDPACKEYVFQANMTRDELIKSLRKMGDDIGNKRGETDNDLSIFDSEKKIKNRLLNSSNEVTINWIEGLGGINEVMRRISLIREIGPGDMKREQMPVIKPSQLRILTGE